MASPLQAVYRRAVKPRRAADIKIDSILDECSAKNLASETEKGCAICAFLWLLKQTENVGRVVGPNSVSLQLGPTRIVWDRPQRSIISSHHNP